MTKRESLKRKKVKRRKKRRSLGKVGKGMLAAAAFSLAAANTTTAATITVDNASCTLADAITSANSDTATGGCVAGNGADTIVLPGYSTITLTSELPAITSQITIQGNGATVERDSNASEFRIFTTKSNGDLILDNMTIKGGAAHIGGGVVNTGSSNTTIINCTVTGNTAHWIGGGVGHYDGSSLTIISSTITGNEAQTGGGIGTDTFGLFKLINSTVSGNTAQKGGGVSNGYDVYGYIIHSTITHNKSNGNDSKSASGVYNEDYLKIWNSIVAENTGGVGNCAPVNYNSIYDMGNNWFGDASCNGVATSGNLNLDTNLRDNGGLTKTHALLPGSDAIDAAGNCTKAPVSVTTDQRDVLRPIDGNGDGTVACDIGAFENQLPNAADDTAQTDEDTPVEVSVLNNDFTGDGPRGKLSVTTNPSHGTAVVNDKGTPDDPTDDTITYTPDANYNGKDVFEYRLCDSNGDCDTAHVSLTIRPINDLPSASDDVASTDEDTPVDIPVTANDDFGGDGASNGTITITAGPQHGTAEVKDSGTPDDPTDDYIEYTPDPDYFGDDKLEYQICDSNGDCDTARVSLTINRAPRVFDPPFAIKVVDPAGWPEIEWKMVWINNSNADAEHVLVEDPVQPELTYISGSLQCIPQGASVTSRCEYDAANNMVVWEGRIAPDPGATDENSASNEVVITFKTTVRDGVTSVYNQATGYWDADDDGNIGSDDRQHSVLSDDPTAPGNEDRTEANAIIGVPTVSGLGKKISMIGLMLLGAVFFRQKKKMSEDG